MKNLTTTPTVLRTLGLPVEYGFIDGFISDYQIKKKLVIVKTIDKSKSVKSISASGKKTYSNAPDSWDYSITETRDDLNNSGTYLPNIISMYLHQPKIYINPNDMMEIKMDRISNTTTNNWIAASSLKINMVDENMIVLTGKTELGGSQNVIPKVFVSRINGVSTYKTPVDYLGRDVIGTDTYNNGAPSFTMDIAFENRVVSVQMITNTIIGSGSWSTSTGVWSGGTKIITTTKSVYVPVADLTSLFGKSIEELEDELKTETYCTPLNQDTHITSTSTEVVISGNNYKGITYYSGVDASITKPSGKITSYNKAYPGHVQRWILKQWNPDGTIVAGTGYFGQVWMSQFPSGDDSSITVIGGDKTSYDSATKTLTYNSSLITELWYTFEEMPAQGKNWGGETIIKLPKVDNII